MAIMKDNQEKIRGRDGGLPRKGGGHGFGANPEE
jgi:hypothetical protein